MRGIYSVFNSSGAYETGARGAQAWTAMFQR